MVCLDVQISILYPIDDANLIFSLFETTFSMTIVYFPLKDDEESSHDEPPSTADSAEEKPSAEAKEEKAEKVEEEVGKAEVEEEEGKSEKVEEEEEKNVAKIEETNEEKEKLEEDEEEPPNPELDKYWKAVKNDPSDFTAWTYLLQVFLSKAYDAFSNLITNSVNID